VGGMAAVLDKQAALSDDPRDVDVILPKLATVYNREAAETRLGVAAGDAAGSRSPRTGGHRMLVRKAVFAEQGLGCARGFYRSRASGDEFAGCLDGKLRRKPDPARVGAVGTRSRSSYRDRLTRRNKAQKLLRRRSPRGTTWRRRGPHLPEL